MAHPGMGQSACTRQIKASESENLVYEWMIGYSEVRRLTINLDYTHHPNGLM